MYGLPQYINTFLMYYAVLSLAIEPSIAVIQTVIFAIIAIFSSVGFDTGVSNAFLRYSSKTACDIVFHLYAGYTPDVHIIR